MGNLKRQVRTQLECIMAQPEYGADVKSLVDSAILLGIYDGLGGNKNVALDSSLYDIVETSELLTKLVLRITGDVVDDYNTLYKYLINNLYIIDDVCIDLGSTTSTMSIKFKCDDTIYKITNAVPINSETLAEIGTIILYKIGIGSNAIVNSVIRSSLNKYMAVVELDRIINYGS